MAAIGGEFTLPVEGIGEFTFRRRTIRLNIAIGVEQTRLSEGVTLDKDFALFVEAVATLKVLTSEAPKDWDVDAMDVFDDDSYAHVMEVWSALREKEATFLKRPPAAVHGGGEDSGADDRVLVSAEVSASSDGSKVP